MARAKSNVACTIIALGNTLSTSDRIRWPAVAEHLDPISVGAFLSEPSQYCRPCIQGGALSTTLTTRLPPLARSPMCALVRMNSCSLLTSNSSEYGSASPFSLSAVMQHVSAAGSDSADANTVCGVPSRESPGKGRVHGQPHDRRHNHHIHVVWQLGDCQLHCRQKVPHAILLIG